MQAGELAEAEGLCRTILSTEPNDVPSIHLLGFIAYKAGRFDAAIALIEQAIGLDARNPDCHFNIGLALIAAGRLPEAVTHFDQAVALKPDYSAAVGNLVNLAYTTANRALEHGRLYEAIAGYRQVVAIRSDFAEAHSNLGVALMAQGNPVDAAAAYRRAVEINPNLITTHRNLARALLVQGDVIGAVAQVRHALTIAEPNDLKRFFVECLLNVHPGTVAAQGLSGVEPLIARALIEAWGRPEDLAGVAADLVKRKLAPDNALLLVLLETTPVRDIELERWLICERSRLLKSDQNDGDLAFACALARQCFINEYAFALDEEELWKVARLRDGIAAGEPPTPFQLALLAAYIPLHTLPNPERLLTHAWPPPLNAVLDQQIRQPMQERIDRDAVSVLTAIDNFVSQAVREQYEEMPYPRWVKAALIGAPIPIEQHLRGQFRLAPLRSLGTHGRIDILVAGCGTGMHPIETARRYSNAQVLAIDLSLSSLCYARRMTRELGLTNVEYAQADILKLGTISRSFDVIESAGVLHHLADPLEGWRILLSLLRTNGLMLVGLYSKFARREITLAREFIAQRGYRPTANDIRRCRQDIMGLDDAAPLKSVTKFWDFYSTSTCRDLIFHVHEQRFTLPDIKTFLQANGLTFLGFIVDPVIQQHYRMRFPHDSAMTDLDCWDVLEAENPLIFKAMYQFWVQKA
jgi:Flp pilus assembly protein TadD/SAM-dependent methyltransferase